MDLGCVCEEGYIKDGISCKKCDDTCKTCSTLTPSGLIKSYYQCKSCYPNHIFKAYAATGNPSGSICLSD